LRAQIESFPALQPAQTGARNSPIRDVLLTNADLDHVLGLFLLREHTEKLRVHCTNAVRDTLQAALRMDALLDGFCGVEWCELPETPSPFPANDKMSGVTYRAIPLPAQPPRYAKTAPASGQSVALEFIDGPRGRRALIAPDVSTVTPELQSALEAADAVIFDGTFWSENELRGVDSTARTASEMGHLPVAGGSLNILRGLRARHRIYTHINNTNPILAPGSPERAEVENAGIAIGEDGMDLEL
jgi:pyrroloquinoline quinone biosynthesis protein B